MTFLDLSGIYLAGLVKNRYTLNIDFIYKQILENNIYIRYSESIFYFFLKVQSWKSRSD